MPLSREDLIRRFAPAAAHIFDRSPMVALPALPRSAAALLVYALRDAFHCSVVWVCDGPPTLESVHRDLLTLAPDPNNPPWYYPARETVPSRQEDPDPDITGHRLTTLLALAPEAVGSRLHGTPPAGPGSSTPAVIATCVQALMQRTDSPLRLLDQSCRIAVGAEWELQDLAERLAESAYRLEPEVLAKGQASIRGGIVDVWPLTELWPVRIELAGTTVDTIRTFDPATQRSVEKRQTVCLPPVHDGAAGPKPASLPDAAGQDDFLSFLPPATLFAWSDPEAIREHAALQAELYQEAHADALAVSFDDLRARIGQRVLVRQIFIGAEPATTASALPPEFPADIESIPGMVPAPRVALQPDIVAAARRRFLSDLRRDAVSGQDVLIFFDTQGALEHLLHLPDADTDARRVSAARPDPLVRIVGPLSEGFISRSLRLHVVAESDLYGRRPSLNARYDPQRNRPRPEAATGLRVADFTDVEPGDLVVHAQHGIGRYMGLREIDFNGQKQEVLTLEYADNAKLHVPVSHAHLLSRYVGMSHQQAQLHRLGGKRWAREKTSAERSILDLAAALLETQARRDLLPGHAFAPDGPWQHEFETSFPFKETPDQESVIREVKRDMESTRPMDRLVCGDAGYGKTEVAMRAAFKAVMEGKQVAVLVPTTVLAQQHFETFSERLSAYPLRVEMLSRFRGRAERLKILEALALGSVDIVIGTHALVQSGVRFKDLGLVIIDEEQRFGVIHKERLKEMRRLVDVLTLTATPIPRTLYLSLTGARDMSLLQTPPRERMAIQTIVVKTSDAAIREAILREITRGGQVFYLHNRVMTIDWVRERLEALVPEARMEVAHGQMPTAELAAVMRRFTAGQFDLLLCTTIIESGVDIPRANTILIDRADRFGIADLYQLRGRVGRSSRKAYAYLLLPDHGRVDPDARKRIGALTRHSGLSAGFSLAMRDLEIRGAGNLLGAAQSGHISAIGFGLYCQLLKRTVAGLKHEPLPPIVDVEILLDFLSLSPVDAETGEGATIPYAYIEDERLRVAAYRRLSETSSESDIDALRRDWTDRYGPAPPPVVRLLKVAALRVACARSGISRVETRAGKILMTRGADCLMRHHRFPRLSGATADEKLDDLLALAEHPDDEGDAAAE